MRRFAVINSFLICTTFANTNVYNSSNGWIPLRFTEVSTKIKNDFKEARDYSNVLMKAPDSREELLSNAHTMNLIMPPVKSNPGSNKIFFLQPDTKDSSEIFASPLPKLPDVQPTTMNTAEDTNDSENSSFEMSQPTTKSIFRETRSTRPVTEATTTCKKELDTLFGSQNNTEVNKTINVRQSKRFQDNKFDNDLHNFYENVVMNGYTSTEIASLEKYFKITKHTVAESSTILYTKSTDDDVGNIRNKPVVVPISPRNMVSSNLLNLLMRYNSKSIPMLNNYAISKTNFNDYSNMFNLYRQQKPSLVAIPFRYNILNHLPVNPLLAVFLSNYGYSLKDADADGDEQISKKLYGYYNNIHRHENPFTSK